MVRLSFQEKPTTDIEMTSFSEIDDDALILSVLDDFHGSNEGGDEEGDALLASLPEPEESSAKSSDEIGDESQISRPDHSKNPWYSFSETRDQRHLNKGMGIAIRKPCP